MSFSTLELGVAHVQCSQVGHVASQTGGLLSVHSSSHPRAVPSSSPDGVVGQQRVSLHSSSLMRTSVYTANSHAVPQADHISSSSLSK